MEADTGQRDPETYAVIGAAMAVHGTLGHGFLESVYQEALGIELESRHIPFEREVQIKIHYAGKSLASRFQADFVCFGNVLVELKACKTIEDSHRGQVINYLKATGLPKGLLINFGSPSLQYQRFVF